VVLSDNDGDSINVSVADCATIPCPEDLDGDDICDIEDDCVGVYDECGECNGDGIVEGACDCAGNVADCAGDCAGDAVVDECGECNGDGIDEGTCDCTGNIIDDCGECGGDNSSCSGCTDSFALNYDEDATIDNDSCEYTAYFTDFPSNTGVNEMVIIENVLG
jgi:hypothetical protein